MPDGGSRLKGYIDLDAGERLPEPSIGTIVKQRGEFFEIIDEKTLAVCHCGRMECAGGKRAHKLYPVNLAG